MYIHRHVYASKTHLCVVVEGRRVVLLGFCAAPNGAEEKRTVLGRAALRPGGEGLDPLSLGHGLNRNIEKRTETRIGIYTCIYI